MNGMPPDFGLHDVRIVTEDWAEDYGANSILEAYQTLQEEMNRARTVWYYCSDIVPAESPPEPGAEPEPSVFLLKDEDAGDLVLLHPDHEEQFVAQAEAHGLIAREMDREEGERRARISFERMMNKTAGFSLLHDRMHPGVPEWYRGAE